jgi:hypothetical protein
MDAARDSVHGIPLAEITAEADRIVTHARERQVTAPLIGGIAIFLRCPSASVPPLRREYKDIDLITTKGMTQRITSLLQELGYEPDKRFNALHGGQRLFFWDAHNGRQLDIFVDRFEMCHTIDLRNRVALDPLAPTLPLADLLLTKMQVVEINFKDMQDIAALLQDYPLTSNEEGINIDYITALTRNDWGLQHTLEGTIAHLQQADILSQLIVEGAPYSLATQLAALKEAMDMVPKSTAWKLRAKIGERKRWYELPEDARA